MFKLFGEMITIIFALSLCVIFMLDILDTISGSKCIWKIERAVKNYCKRH